MTYAEVEAKVKKVSAGLKDLVGDSDSKVLSKFLLVFTFISSQVVIFAETRAHWLITALSCFRANITIVTVYATLGEDVCLCLLICLLTC